MKGSHVSCVPNSSLDMSDWSHIPGAGTLEKILKSLKIAYEATVSQY